MSDYIHKKCINMTNLNTKSSNNNNHVPHVTQRNAHPAPKSNNIINILQIYLDFTCISRKIIKTQLFICWFVFRVHTINLFSGRTDVILASQLHACAYICVALSPCSLHSLNICFLWNNLNKGDN